jgi:hypothetical protein
MKYEFDEKTILNKKIDTIHFQGTSLKPWMN